LLAHCGALAHVAPSSLAQVSVRALQAPPAHTEAALPAVHSPSWRPSSGIGAPEASFATQVFVGRLQ
jgi:hypothetical protein